MRRWAVLISGRGSNLGALIDARVNGFDLQWIVSSSEQAYGILRARRAGIGVSSLPREMNSKRTDWMELDRQLRARGITHIFLAGFMKIVPARFVSLWENRVFNLHPSLLPIYPGLRSIERAHEERANMGVTVHLVNEEVDAGRIVSQRLCLKASEVGGYLLDSAELKMHIDEQRVIKEAAVRWNP